MTNLPVFNSLIEGYERHSFTNSYIFGFTYAGNIWYVETTSKLLPMISKLDKASRGAGYTLRFKPDRQQKLLLMAQGARTLCSKEFFEDLVKDSKYNKGEIFEKLITEMNGQEWTKDKEPFWTDGDLTVNGKAFQIKFEKATFTNEKTLAGLSA